MDPYQGLQMGNDRSYEGNVADDLGIGLTGYAVLFGLEYYADRGGYLPFTGAGDVGMGGGKKLLEVMKLRSQMPGQPGMLSPKDYAQITNMQGYNPLGHRTLRQYNRMEKDIGKLKGGFKQNPMAGLYNKSRGSFTRLRSRYGTNAAARIWGVTQIGKFARVANIVSLASLGAELGGGLVNAINDYQPTLLKTGGPSPEFGQQYEMPMSRTAWTQRQASLQAIHQSGLQARAALGNEAALMHR